ncbi:hypothetical protein UlMin_033867 [Ulmus minor]
MEAQESNGMEIELVDASIEQRESILPNEEENQNPSPTQNGQPPLPETNDQVMEEAERTELTLEEDRVVDANVGNANAENHPVPAGNASPKKVLTRKTEDKNVEKVKNGVSTLKSEDKNAEKVKKEVSILKPQDKNEVNDTEMAEDEESGASEDGTPEQQSAFLVELENFCREKGFEFRPLKFYGEPLNLLKLWRAVIKLGGYEVVTASKLWRQVGESFHPPKTCTTVSWTFRQFYEKSLIEYERHKRQIGELQLPVGTLPQATSIEKEATHQAPGSGRARRDAAARAMQGWHAQRLLGYGEVSEPIIKDKNIHSASKRERNLKSIGSLKHKTSSTLELPEKTVDADKQLVTSVVDVGPPADWVKISVRELKDCFEVYALVPGLLREEVRIQSDPAGRLVITGQPDHVDNPWGITAFQKVVSLPARIDPLHTSAVVSLHGRLYVRVPFENHSN